MTPADLGPSGYALEEGIHRPTAAPILHRSEDYPERGFDVQRDMQSRHFWYRGRERFLLRALRKHAGWLGKPLSSAKAIDLGGGCGAWITSLSRAERFHELALGDSSLAALKAAGSVLPEGTGRYQVDLLRLGWSSRWDVVFLLDVLEHVSDDRGALESVARALSPGGLVFLTVPALRRFWTWNDEVVGHHRRYSTRELRDLASRCGLSVLDARYFMFFLSPFLLLSRMSRTPDLSLLSPEEQWTWVERTHRVPPRPLNSLLGAVFGLETPLGHWIRFPWGTSALAVLRKPCA